MKAFTTKEHCNALLRRRIKFVVEKGAMARLFRAGTNRELQEALFHILQPSELALIQTGAQYDEWLVRTVESDRWSSFSRNGIAKDRWGYFAKLINIVVYEIVSNRELFRNADWKRLRPFLHIPVDSTITYHLSALKPTFPKVKRLKGMTKKTYLDVQGAAQQLANQHHVPRIWFEAAWSAE